MQAILHGTCKQSCFVEYFLIYERHNRITIPKSTFKGVNVGLTQRCIVISGVLTVCISFLKAVHKFALFAKNFEANLQK